MRAHRSYGGNGEYVRSAGAVRSQEQVERKLTTPSAE